MAYTALGRNIAPTKIHLLMIIGVLILMVSDHKMRTIGAIDSLLSQVAFTFNVCFMSVSGQAAILNLTIAQTYLGVHYNHPNRQIITSAL